MKKNLRINTLFSLLLLLFFSHFSAAELVCEPLILAKEKTTIPPQHARGLLWKISRIGLEPSYLFGTIHLPDKELTTLPKPVLDALDNALSVTLEVKLEDDTFAKMSHAMFYKEEASLQKKIGTDLYQQTLLLLSRYSFPETISSKLKPWAAYLTLSVPPSKGGLPLDMVILKRGKQFGSRIYGLETVEEQLSIFADLKMDTQTQLLTDTVCHYDTLQQNIAEMKALYLKRDLAGLVKISEKYDNGSMENYDALLQELITNRNVKMYKRMQDRLIEGNAFIAVGALHLPGEDGILGLLEAEGFIISSIY